MKDLSKEYQDDMKKQIIMTALGDGFFSIWMEVFCDEQEIRLAMIKAYPGTNLNCNDANGCVKETFILLFTMAGACLIVFLVPGLFVLFPGILCGIASHLIEPGLKKALAID